MNSGISIDKIEFPHDAFDNRSPRQHHHRGGDGNNSKKNKSMNKKKISQEKMNYNKQKTKSGYFFKESTTFISGNKTVNQQEILDDQQIKTEDQKMLIQEYVP